MKKSIYYICLIAAILCLQGCPYIGPNDPENPKGQTEGMGNNQTCNNTIFGQAYLLSPSDSVSTRYYLEAYSQNYTISPSNYLQEMIWTAVASDYDSPVTSQPYDAEKNQLHIKKLTNYSEAIVLECGVIYINDERWPLSNFRDPSDTIIIEKNALGKQDTIRQHFKIPPYDLQKVIEQLELNYPELVHRINDTTTHHFKNYEVSRNPSLFPKIYLQK